MSSARSNDIEAWSEALDTFERRVEEFRTVLEPDGTPPQGLWPPPSLIGRPFPPELAERAQQLLNRSDEIEAELRTRQQELPTPPKAHPRHRRNRRGTVSAFL